MKPTLKDVQIVSFSLVQLNPKDRDSWTVVKLTTKGEKIISVVATRELCDHATAIEELSLVLAQEWGL